MGGGGKGTDKYGSDGAETGGIYMSVVQTMLIYGQNSWKVTETMLKLMEGFTIGWNGV